jgi:type IV secretion system protein TrbF
MNPYLEARRRWNSEVDRAVGSLHVWQLVGVAGMLMGVGGVGGMIWLGGQSRYVPYVIEVDRLGEAVGVGVASVAGPADERVVRASVGAFVGQARMVTPDIEVQRRAIFSVYGMLKTRDPACVKMNEYLGGEGENSPFARAARETVSCDISSVLPVSKESWQVDWQETVCDRDGGLIGKPEHMRAVLSIYIQAPGLSAKASEIMRNPLGVYVRDFNWQVIQ